MKKQAGPTLFGDEAFKNENADRPWLKIDTDHMLDRFCIGGSPKVIAHDLKRNPKAIRRRCEQFVYNERNRATDYQPKQRVSRAGRNLTKNEEWLIQEHRKRNIPTSVTARVLQRNANEIAPDVKGEIQLNAAKAVASTDLDVLWATSYVLHACHYPIISTQAYEAEKKDQIEFGDGVDVITDKKFESENNQHYPPHIRSLGYYLLDRHMKSTGKWDPDKLPLEFSYYAGKLKRSLKRDRSGRNEVIEESLGSMMSFDERDLE